VQPRGIREADNNISGDTCRHVEACGEYRKGCEIMRRAQQYVAKWTSVPAWGRASHSGVSHFGGCAVVCYGRDQVSWTLSIYLSIYLLNCNTSKLTYMNVGMDVRYTSIHATYTNMHLHTYNETACEIHVNLQKYT
jgi:hypothetical protein